MLWDGNVVCSTRRRVGVEGLSVTESVRVAVAGATLTGVREGGVSRYGCIRYALAPTGLRRFRPPVAASLEGDVDASHVGPVGPQLPSLLRGVVGDIHAPQSEDCLHLTVWTPGDTGARLPVLVWIHGGAWQSGGAALSWYDGARLSRQGQVLVVALSYRLGPLGWLHADGAVSNLGLLDLALALDWVVDHIAEFGGDPEAITLMGQSAGAVNVACLMARPKAVRRVILQSAPLGRSLRHPEAAARVGEAILHAAGVRDLDEARSLPIESLLHAQQAPQVRATLEELGDGHGLFCPVLDGSTLPADFSFDQAAGQADVLIGTNRDEMAAFPGRGVDAGSAEQGRKMFADPAHRWAATARCAGKLAWQYRFDIAPTANFGSCHCVELPFVFGTWEAFSTAPMLRGLHHDDAMRMTQEIQGTWLAFVRGESPSWAGYPDVHVFDTEP